MRMIFSLIGYVATATLLALGIGCAYLWQNNMITNEKMFHIVALLHDVDIDAIAKEEQVTDRVTPEQEASLNDKAMMSEIKLRDYEVKTNALKMGTKEFERNFKDVSEGRKRFDQMAQELKDRLKKQKELSSHESLSAVVRQLQSIKPANAKEILQLFLDEPNGERDVIILMKEMQPTQLARILQQFKTPDELEKMQKLQSLMLSGFPEGPDFDNMLERVKLQDEG